MLLDSDLSGPGRDDDGVGDGHHEISWIWRIPRTATVNYDEASEYNNSMRAEWARSRARAERWEEEVDLLVEEMQRIIRFLESESAEWQARADRRVKMFTNLRIPFDLEDGVRAFAMHHVALYKDLASRFVALWTPLLVTIDRSPSWSSEYVTQSLSTDDPAISSDSDASEDD